MKIEHPTPGDIPALRKLWKIAFGDTDEFLDRFFSLSFSPARCRCVLCADGAAAAHYWFDCTLGGQKFAYIYAVATDPAHRGKGLCRALMADAQKLLAERGYHGLILVPQDVPLVAMYEKLGFAGCTSVSEFTAPGEEPIPLRRLTAEEYAAARRELLPSGGMVQEAETLRLLASFAWFFRGPDWLAAVSVEEDKLRCHELLGNPDAAYGIVSAMGCREGSFRIPGKDTPFAMYLPLRPDCRKPEYFGLALD